MVLKIGKLMWLGCTQPLCISGLIANVLFPIMEHQSCILKGCCVCGMSAWILNCDRVRLLFPSCRAATLTAQFTNQRPSADTSKPFRVSTRPAGSLTWGSRWSRLWSLTQSCLVRWVYNGDKLNSVSLSFYYQCHRVAVVFRFTSCL